MGIIFLKEENFPNNSALFTTVNGIEYVPAKWFILLDLAL